MKILICNKFYRPFGGPETQLIEGSRLLEADGHEVIPFSMSHPDNWATQWSRYFVPEVDYHGEPGILSRARDAVNIIYSREARRRLESLLRECNPDLAHLHNIYHQLSPSIFGPIRKRGIPIVMSLHDYKLACPNMLFYIEGKPCERCSGGKFYNAVVHKCVFGSRAASSVCAMEMYIHRLWKVYQRNVDIFLSPSRFLIDALTRCGAAGKKMEHLPGVADTDSYTPSYDSDGYVLCFGKLSPEKGMKTMIRAIAEVPSARLVIAGTGAQRQELETLAQELAPGRVQFAGFLSGSELRQVVERCALFVIPSEWYENCPTTVLEAYSAGKPVIGSRIGGIPELIDEGADGLLFEPGSHSDLAEKVSSLLGRQSVLADMGKAGRAKMETKYSRQAYRDRLLRAYSELVPGFRPST